MIKKLVFALIIGVIAVTATPAAVYARRGDMGFFGGISEGSRLPRTTETAILERGNGNGRARNGGNNGTSRLEYREMILLSGTPYQFDGTLVVTGGRPAIDSEAGTFQVRHAVEPSIITDDGVTVARNMQFNVSYRREGTQIVFFYEINPSNWSCVITTPDGTFTLIPERSSFIVSTIEYRNPGVTFYRGDISARLMYATDGDATVTVEKHGSFYGFFSAWSASETHRIDVTVTNEDGTAMQYQIRPSVSVNKILQFVHNEPTVISFEGNFREVHQSFAGLRYDIFSRPDTLWDQPMYGTVSLETVNVFEQLPAATNMSHLRGHPAEDDIHRLFAMQVLTGDPRFFEPSQAITRGQFMTALARAINLPIENPAAPRGRMQPVIVTLFTDVDSNRPEFRYIQAVQREGIAFGRADGKFYFDYPIQRQEAFATTVRALGLSHLGLNPTVVTPFLDTDRIAYWAIQEMGVASMLGIIRPDANGNINPTNAITKGEAAALLNHLIEYMRTGLISDYTEQIVNIAR